MQEYDRNIGRGWSLVDPLTVQQAAALVAGLDPHWVKFNAAGPDFVEYPDGANYPDIAHLMAVFSGLTQAINARSIEAAIRYSKGDLAREVRDGTFATDPDWAKTTVPRGAVITWLESKGWTKGFFFPAAKAATVPALPGYLDSNHPRYAPKLAAAVRAWEAMEGVNLSPGRTPLQATIAWLESNHAEFDLTHKQSGRNKSGETTHRAGERNDGAIGEIARIATREKPGAPKTPG